MDLNFRFNLVENTIQKYFYGVKINYEILIHFYEDLNDFEEYESISRIIKNVKGYLFCKDCKIEFININNLPIISCPQCNSIDLKTWHQKLVNDSETIIKKENLIDGPLKKSWFDLFDCEPTYDFYYKGYYNSYKEHSKVYDDTIYSNDVLCLEEYWSVKTRILEVKDKKNNAIMYYSDILNNLISQKAILCSVPRSQMEMSSGVDEIIYQLCQKHKSRENLTGLQNKKNQENYNIDKTLLIRTKNCSPQHKNGGFRRSREEEKNSVDINEKLIKKINKKNVLLLDDVKTSGMSISISRKKILNAGANRVICLALSKAGN